MGQVSPETPADDRGFGVSRRPAARGDHQDGNRIRSTPGTFRDGTVEVMRRLAGLFGMVPVAVAAGIAAGVAIASGGAQVRSPTFERIVIDASPGRAALLEKAVGDLNGDGRADYVVGTSDGVFWYANPGTGNVHDRWVKRVILAGGSAYEGMRVLDLNGDGRPDIVLSIDSSVEWLENPGSGGGAWAVHPIARGTAHELWVRDIDGDGRPDVVTSRTRNIDFRNADSSWATVPWGAGASGVPVDGLALLNIGSGRGAVNIVGANSGGIYWFENPRELGGSARTAQWIAHRIGPNEVEAPTLTTADVNGDGRADVIQAPNEGAQGTQAIVWWQAPQDRRAGTWQRHAIAVGWQNVHAIVTGDFNRDGKLDLLVPEEEQSHDVEGSWDYHNDRVAIFSGTGKGGFVQTVLARTGGHNPVTADFNRDGRLDFINSNHGVYGAPKTITLYLNTLRKKNTP